MKITAKSPRAALITEETIVPMVIVPNPPASFTEKVLFLSVSSELLPNILAELVWAKEKMENIRTRIIIILFID
jgi:hypothetical protein